MRIVLLGAPGSGKGTQAQFIIRKYDIPKISSGDMLRNIIRSSKGVDKTAKDMIDTGQLVNDDLVINLVKQRLLQEDCCNGFLLDGFPRTLPQANAIKDMGINIDYILEFYVPYELITHRISGRRIHADSGRIYHTKFNPPKIEGKDDLTGEELIIREDDRKEVLFNRLKDHHNMMISLINFYQKEAQTSKTRYIKIDGTKSIAEIHKELKKILG